MGPVQRRGSGIPGHDEHAIRYYAVTSQSEKTWMDDFVLYAGGIAIVAAAVAPLFGWNILLNDVCEGV